MLKSYLPSLACVCVSAASHSPLPCPATLAFAGCMPALCLTWVFDAEQLCVPGTHRYMLNVIETVKALCL